MGHGRATRDASHGVEPAVRPARVHHQVSCSNVTKERPGGPRASGPRLGAPASDGQPGHRAAVDVLEPHIEACRDAWSNIFEIDTGKHRAARDAGADSEQESVGPVVTRAPVSVRRVHEPGLRRPQRLDGRGALPVDEQIRHGVRRRPPVPPIGPFDASDHAAGRGNPDQREQVMGQPRADPVQLARLGAATRFTTSEVDFNSGELSTGLSLRKLALRLVHLYTYTVYSYRP